MDFFERRGSALFCEELPLRELAIQYGTPLYIYSYATLARHFRVFDEALSAHDHLICFSVKANGNLALLYSLAQMGAGADVVSGGELFRALKAGIDPSKIVFSGVGKTVEEINYALSKEIHSLHVESVEEMRRIAAAAEAKKVKARICFRLNPDVDPKTHPYISTGLRENKFGMSRESVEVCYREASTHSFLDPIGIAFHIGSQICEIEPFTEAVAIAVDVIRTLRKKGFQVRTLDCGGGLGVRYRSETPPSPAEYAAAISRAVVDLDLRVIVEPGRALIANAGVLLTRVIAVKETDTKKFIVVDAGMNDLLRPALYDAEHEIVPVLLTGRPPIRADVVGPICETADFLARGRDLPEPSDGELLCVRTAGAYGFSMSSQYNARPRAAEVLVQGDRVGLIRQRESFDDLIQGEEIPAWIKESA